MREIDVGRYLNREHAALSGNVHAVARQEQRIALFLDHDDRSLEVSRRKDDGSRTLVILPVGLDRESQRRHALFALSLGQSAPVGPSVDELGRPVTGGRKIERSRTGIGVKEDGDRLAALGKLRLGRPERICHIVELRPARGRQQQCEDADRQEDMKILPHSNRQLSNSFCRNSVSRCCPMNTSFCIRSP